MGSNQINSCNSNQFLAEKQICLELYTKLREDSQDRKRQSPGVKQFGQVISLRGADNRLLSPQRPRGRREEHFLLSGERPTRGWKAKRPFSFAASHRQMKILSLCSPRLERVSFLPGRVGGEKIFL
jgi:hypothetical protein